VVGAGAGKGAAGEVGAEAGGCQQPLRCARGVARGDGSTAWGERAGKSRVGNIVFLLLRDEMLVFRFQREGPCWVIQLPLAERSARLLRDCAETSHVFSWEANTVVLLESVTCYSCNNL